MVYAATLSMIVKKAMANKCRQASVDVIINTLPIDAATSGMDILMLGPNDLKGAAGKQMLKAVEARHPSICVIYLCSSDKEANLFPNAPNVKRYKKLNADVIKEAISEFYGKDIQVINAKYDSMADKNQGTGKNPVPIPAKRPLRKKVEVQEEKFIDPTPAPVQPEEPTLDVPDPDAPPVEETPVEPPMPAQRDLPPSPSEVAASCHTIGDWDVLKSQLRRDAIMADALLKSSEMAGIRQMMDVWDVKMTEVMADSHLTNEQKLQAIREFGNNRSMLQASQNSKLVDDFIKVLQTVTSVASRIVDDRLSEINGAVVNAEACKASYFEQVMAGQTKPAQAIASYTYELVNIKNAITELYAFAYNEVSSQLVGRFDEKLPSENEYINATLGRMADNFKPVNSKSLVSQLFQGLKESRMSLTQVQDKIDALVATLFNIIRAQSETMEYHQEVMSCLKANHVENIVIRNTLLKDCFRIFVGTQGTGLTATVTMFAGMQARRGNTLVIDLTGHASYERYGIKPCTMERFMAERVQEPILYVTSNEKHDPEKLAILMEECKSRMTYYSALIFVLDAAQIEELDQVGREALTISYVTNCTTESLDSITTCYERAREIPNVGTLLCAIDAPVDATVIINTLKMDISRTRLVLIPYLRDIRKAAIVHDNPANYGDCLRIFETAFRV